MIELAQFRQLLSGAGIPDDEHDGVIRVIEDFVGGMAAILGKNKKVAPNYITLGVVAGEENYELTIRHCGGVTPAARAHELEGQLAIKSELVEALRVAVGFAVPFSRGQHDFIAALRRARALESKANVSDIEGKS